MTEFEKILAYLFSPIFVIGGLWLRYNLYKKKKSK
jgi:hypothetical protein